jgi:hypothetical protein
MRLHLARLIRARDLSEQMVALDWQREPVEIRVALSGELSIVSPDYSASKQFFSRFLTTLSLSNTSPFMAM